MSISITNPNNRPVVSAEASGIGEDGVAIAIDYTTYYDRIATALENISTQTTTIATQVTTIAAQTTTIATQATTIAAQTTIVATQTTTVASKQTAMETYQKKLKELGEGSGIRVIGPYEVFGMISIYRLLIEQAKILDTTESASASQIQAAITEVTRLAQLIRSNVPKEF
jgi:hypothetical protein